MKRLAVLSDSPLLQAVDAIAERLSLRIYPVGGCVRDALGFNRLARDLDFLVLRPEGFLGDAARQLAEACASHFSGSLVTLDADWGIYRVVMTHDEKRYDLDFSNALENSIDKDLARRDLSINAMAFDGKTGALLDPFNGQSDLAHRRVRLVNESNLIDDPLRMLRVFRFAAKLSGDGENAVIEAETLTAVQRHRERIHMVAAERVQHELYQLVSSDACFPALLSMAEAGLLETLFPEMTPMRQIPANGHHHLGLFDHTLELVRQAERLLPTLPDEDQAYFAAPFAQGEVSRAGLVKLACLFHDLGKPDTQGEKTGATGGVRLTFHGHEQVSEDMTDAICKRLKTGNEIRKHLKHLTRWHLYPCQFGESSPQKSVLRFFRRMGEATPDVLLLALADRHSTLGPEVSKEILDSADHNHRWLLAQYRLFQNTLKIPPLVNGHAVMQALGKPPGPWLKAVLAAVEEAQQLGEVQTPDEAIAWVRARF